MDILATYRADKKFGKFWRYKKFKSKTSVPVSAEELHKLKDIAEFFSEHFRIKPGKAHAATRIESSAPAKHTDVANGIQFTPEHVANIVRRIKVGNSLSFDGVGIEHKLYAGDKIFRLLADSFNRCKNYGYLLNNSMKAVVIPFPVNTTGDLSCLRKYKPML